MDTTTSPVAATAVPDDTVVNGPSDERLDWDAVQWRRVEADVQRLRQRIFAASRVGDLKKVRNLQKLMLRSRSNALLAVRRVTQLNAGRVALEAPEHVALDVVAWMPIRQLFDAQHAFRPVDVAVVTLVGDGHERDGVPAGGERVPGEPHHAIGFAREHQSFSDAEAHG